jgi:hypothetical protein
MATDRSQNVPAAGFVLTNYALFHSPAPTKKFSQICNLVFGIWNFIGIWSLEFGVSLELGSWCLKFLWSLDLDVWSFSGAWILRAFI